MQRKVGLLIITKSSSLLSGAQYFGCGSSLKPGVRGGLSYDKLNMLINVRVSPSYDTTFSFSRPFSHVFISHDIIAI